MLAFFFAPEAKVLANIRFLVNPTITRIKHRRYVDGVENQVNLHVNTGSWICPWIFSPGAWSSVFLAGFRQNYQRKGRVSHGDKTNMEAIRNPANSRTSGAGSTELPSRDLYPKQEAQGPL